MQPPLQHSRSFLAGILLPCVLFLATPCATAQVQGLPRASQRARTSQVIGVSEFEVVYHRPGVKGREIFGDLVPYGEIWRAGANENTVLVLQHPATVEGKPVAAGMYGLHMIPGEETWTVILSKDSTSWGSYSYMEKLDALRAEVTPEEAEFKEWLQYEFDPLSGSAAVLALRWANTRVPIRIEVDTPERVLELLRESVQGHLADRWQTWYDAARYCADTGLYSEEALSWIDHALEMQRSFASLVVRAALLEGLGRGDEANMEMAAALELGNPNEIAGFGGQLTDAGQHERALDMLQVAVERDPDLWSAWVRMGDAHAALGQTEEAGTSYDRGLELAPAERKSFVKKLRAKLDGAR